MTDSLAILPPFSWRGRQYPVIARNVGFAHESVLHKFQFRDNEAVEQTGAHNLTFSYTLPMRQDIAKGPYRNLFSEGLPQLLIDCRNREAGELIDPIYGTFICTPTSYSDDSDVNKRDGTDIRVEFVHADPSEDESIETPTLQDLATEAGALEQELTLIDWEQEPSPEGMTDPLSAVAGLFGQIDRAGNRIVAAAHDFSYRAEKVEQSIDRLENPEHWHARAAVRRQRLAANDIATRAANPNQQIATVTLRYARGISAVAAEVGMSVADLLRLNPILARTPLVPAGTVVRTQRRV